MGPVGHPGPGQTFFPPCGGPGGTQQLGVWGWRGVARLSPGKPAARSLRGGPWGAVQNPGAPGAGRAGTRSPPALRDTWALGVAAPRRDGASHSGGTEFPAPPTHNLHVSLPPRTQGRDTKKKRKEEEEKPQPLGPPGPLRSPARGERAGRAPGVPVPIPTGDPARPGEAREQR